MHGKSRSLWGRILGVLASLKLSIFLFFALAATSVFGTVVQQQGDPQAYIESYGPRLAAAFEALGLVDMYHSWWFELLLALLLANTLVCSLRRLPAALRALRREQFLGSDELAGKPQSSSWDAPGAEEAAVTEALAESFGAPRVRRDEAGVSWFVQRQPWARMGAYVAHASLVLFFLGGIVGARYGFKGFVNVGEGESVSAVGLRGGGSLTLPFELGCEKFELHRYPDGRPKDYLSRLVVRREGVSLQEKTIEVNDPLIQDGIYFYQSSYGQVGGGAVLRVSDAKGNPLGSPLRLAEEQAAPVPGAGVAVELVATAEDYNGFGPAAQLVLVAEGPDGHRRLGKPFVVLQNFPSFDQRRGGEQVFQLAGLIPGRWYTGLQVAKDPGVPLVWTASVLLTLGTLMAFFASHRRVWARLEGGRLTVAGAAANNPHGFAKTFEGVAQRLRTRTECDVRVRRAAG
jgi:cytochrome c biogenesis protein